jgi:hypothetical protein
MARKEIPRELETAIREEEKAARFNAESAGLTDNPLGAAMFRELAEFHTRNAELLKKRLTPGYEKGDMPGEKIPAVDFAAMKVAPTHADALTALQADIELERENGERMRLAAARAKPGEEQALLRRAAEEIEQSRRLLDDEFYVLTNSGPAVWGD